MDGRKLSRQHYGDIMATVTNYYSQTFTPSLSGFVGRESVNQTFTNIRAGAGTTNGTADSSGLALTATSTTNQYSSLYRYINLFNTSAIPSSATVTSATLTTYSTGKTGNLGSPGLVVVSSNPASNSVLANGDYSTLGSTSFGTLSYASYATSGGNPVSLNSSGLSNITKNGTSKFGVVFDWDFNAAFTGTWSSTATSALGWYNTSQPPTLTVNWTVDFPTLSINNISSLANVTTITTS